MTAEEINRLAQALEHGAKSYYVYALCLEDGTPFYIGKGRGARVLAHEQDAADAEDALEQMRQDESLSETERQAAYAALSEKIRTIINAHGTIKRVVVKWGLTSQEAFMCESALINLMKFTTGRTIGRLTNIVNGHASEPEEASAADMKTKARTVEAFMQECALAERPVDAIGVDVALININRLYPKCIEADGRINNEKVKDCVRGLWRLGAARVGQIKYVFALYHRRVVGVYHVSRPAKRLAQERAAGLPDFPAFPEDVRRSDWLKSSAGTLAEASQRLDPQAYAELVGILEDEAAREMKPTTPEQILHRFQSRVYFVLDDNVPAEIAAFKDTFPTKDGSTDFIRKGHAQFSPVTVIP